MGFEPKSLITLPIEVINTRDTYLGNPDLQEMNYFHLYQIMQVLYSIKASPPHKEIIDVVFDHTMLSHN